MLISMLEKLNLFHLTSLNNAGAIDVKMDGSVLEEKIILMLGLTFSSKLDWISDIISSAKTASKNIGALICSKDFSFS